MLCDDGDGPKISVRRERRVFLSVAKFFGTHTKKKKRPSRPSSTSFFISSIHHQVPPPHPHPKKKIGKIVEFRIPSSSIEKAAAEAAAAASKASQGTSAQASSKSSTSFAANAAAAAAAAVTTSPADVRGVDPESVEVHLIWWYRPEEARGGRKQFHGEREVFKSAHSDAVPASSLDGK